MPLQHLLLKVPTIRKAWRAGNYQKITKDDVSSVEICEDLHQCKKNLSLKTSSTLIVGVARTYTAELDDLYDDVIKLNKDIMTRNKRRPSDEESESFPSSSTSQRVLASELSTMQPDSTLYSTSTTRSASTSAPTLQSRAETLTLSEPSSQPKSTSQLGSTSQMSSQLKSTPQSRSASPPNCTSQPRPTLQSEHTSQPGSLSQARSTPEPASTFQPESISEPESSYQSNSLSPEETQLSESSTDHEDYFPLNLDSSEYVQQHKLASNYEDTSPTYTTSETRRREPLIASVRYRRRSLSTISEENSSIYRRADSSSHKTSTTIDKTVNKLSKSKRSSSGITKSETTPSVEATSRKKRKSDPSIDSSKSELPERTDVLNTHRRFTEERLRHESNFDEIPTGTTETSVERLEIDEGHERLPSAQRFILQSPNIQSAEVLESRTGLSETFENDNSRYNGTGSDFNKAVIRETDESIENSDTNGRSGMSSEQSIILQGPEKVKNKKDLSSLQKDVTKAGQRVLLAAETSPRTRDQEILVNTLQFKELDSHLLEAGISLQARNIILRDQCTQISPLPSNVLGSEPHLLGVRTSPEIRNVRDQDTEVSFRLSNVVELGQTIGFESHPFGSVSLYGTCQCKPRTPCIIIYSSLEE